MENPKLDCIEFHVKFHKIHADAGWEPISRIDIENRYLFYYQWLINKNLIDVTPAAIDESFILYKNNVTEKGWKFLPKVHDKFVALMVPGRTREQDESYLNKRYKKLVGDEA